ncbi:uncharacterized protein B0H18DRAFT_958366 [Fomitopsis serialis]|uniref:uncharacterized protein n=1 Tax=Fomitopsis serialis TaxID=139415 RepID=UPI00200831FA|nr:uncharacterized protein B0H18DRAFT_958366 [Neoantrodia serialis]KAH9917429.1 hypothetical protein B0H18DRAFT_958366 [Neoantrodia serialis]
MPFARCRFGGAPGGRGRGFSANGGGHSDGIPTGPRGATGRTQDSGWNTTPSGGGNGTASTGAWGTSSGGTSSGGWGASTGETTPGGWGTSTGETPGGWGTSTAETPGGWGNAPGGASPGASGVPSGDGAAAPGGWGTNDWGSNTGAGNGGWDDRTGSGPAAPAPVPAVARAPPRTDTSQTPWPAVEQNTAESWGWASNTGGGSTSDAGGAWPAGATSSGHGGWNDTSQPGASWGVTGEVRATEPPEPPAPNPFSFSEAPQTNTGSGSRSRTVSVSGASSVTARDEPRTGPVVTSNAVHARSPSQDDRGLNGPFAALLGSSAAARRTSYAFDDPTISPSEPTYLAQGDADPDEPGSDEQALSWKSFVTYIYKAVQYLQDITEANAAGDRVRRLLRSRRLQDASEAARSPLEKAYSEHKKSAQKLEKRLEDVLTKLERYPLDACWNGSADNSGDLDALKEYAKDLKDYMAVMNEQMQGIRRLPAEPVADNQPPLSEGNESDFSASLTKVESRIDDLQTYLQELVTHSMPTSVQLAVEEAAARSRAELEQRTAAAEAAIAHAMEQKYVEMKEEIGLALDTLDKLREDVRYIKERDSKWWQEAYKLNAEHEDLSSRLTRLEHERQDALATQNANTRAISDLEAAFRRFSIHQPTPPPPPPPTTDELCARLAELMWPRYEQEVMAAVSAVQDSALNHARKQEELLYSKVYEQLQPSLRVLTNLNEFIEAQRSRAVDPSPALAQLLQQATS